MEDKKKLRITIIGTFIAISLLIVGIVALFFKVNSQPTDSYTQTEEIDPVSGETVLRTEGKTPEKVGQNPNAPLVLGLVKFYDRGLTQGEIENVKAAFTDYANQRIVKNRKKSNRLVLMVIQSPTRLNEKQAMDSTQQGWLSTKRTRQSLMCIPMEFPQ